MSDLAAVFQIGSLGDSIASLPSLRSLRELLPDCSEYVLVSPVDSHTKVAPVEMFETAWPARDIVGYRANGNIAARAVSIAALVSRLRYFRPRYAVCLMPTSRSARQLERDRLFFRMGGIRELIGFRALRKSETPGWYGVSGGIEAYLRFVRLWNEKAGEKFPAYATPPLCQPDAKAQGQAIAWLRKHRRHSGRKLVAVCPFANRPSRTWPVSSAVELVRRLELTADVEVALVGGAKDSEAAEKIVAMAGVGLNACGRFSVAESAALFQHCALVIAVDSGPMHLAAAVGVRTIATFSRADREFARWFPLGKSHSLLYREPMECAGCQQDVCPVEGHPCMRDVTVDQVFAVTMNKLNGCPEPGGVTDGTRILNL